MEWFKHDAGAHMDAKLRKLKIRYGMEGYGLYWYCLELICKDIKQTNLTFQLEHDSEIIADDTGINYKSVEEMIAYMVDLNLFECSGGVITCLKMAKRLDASMTGNPKMRAMIAQVKVNHDSVMTDHDSVMQEKKRIEKNIGGKPSRFSPPSVDQVRDYCRERGNSVDPSAFVDFYLAKGWMVGKNKMKDWKAAVRTWEKNQSPTVSSNPGEFTGVEI